MGMGVVRRRRRFRSSPSLPRRRGSRVPRPALLLASRALRPYLRGRACASSLRSGACSVPARSCLRSGLRLAYELPFVMRGRGLVPAFRRVFRACVRAGASRLSSRSRYAPRSCLGVAPVLPLVPPMPRLPVL